MGKAMPSEAKVTAVEQLTQVLEGAKSIYLTDFTGMTVEMMANLRRRCRESEVEYKVVKDTLTKLAARRAGVDAVIDYLEGPTGLAIGRGDELAPARVLMEFAKENKLPRIKAGLVEGRVFTEDGVKTLAVLPAREVLLGQFVWGLMAPLGGLRGVLQQLVWKMVATLQAVAESRGDKAAVSPEPAGGEAEGAKAETSGVEAGSGATGASEGTADPVPESGDAQGAGTEPVQGGQPDGGDEGGSKTTGDGEAVKGSPEGDA
jgi:large subunit ribosomal protein L10